MPLLALLLRETPTVGKFRGEILSLSGLIRAGTPKALLADGVHADGLLMLMAALSYAAYGALLRCWHVGLRSWQLTSPQAIAALTFMPLIDLRIPWNAVLPDRASLPLITYVGSLASAVLRYFWSTLWETPI
jgi:hypothetical protein